jgi:hypothetical protein
MDRSDKHHGIGLLSGLVVGLIVGTGLLWLSVSPATIVYGVVGASAVAYLVARLVLTRF